MREEQRYALGVFAVACVLTFGVAILSELLSALRVFGMPE